MTIVRSQSGTVIVRAGGIQGKPGHPGQPGPQGEPGPPGT